MISSKKCHARLWSMPSGSTMLLVSMRMFATFFQSCETGSRSNGFYTLMCGKSFLCGMDTRVCGVSGVLGWMLWRLGGVGRGVLFAFQRAKSYGVFDGESQNGGMHVSGSHSFGKSFYIQFGI